MTTMRFRSAAFGLAILVGCTDGSQWLVNPGPPVMVAKAGAGISVTAADPAYGNLGETGKQVRILGSGFEPGDQASWQRNGVADPGVTVLSTQFVSSKELIATINIASEATLALYDIAILRPGRKGGIGTEMFEVTTVVVLPSLGGPIAVANGLNDEGQIVGQSGGQAFFWSQATGIDDLGTGTAYDLDAAGARIVGTTALSTSGLAVWWTGGPGAWSQAALSTACATGAQYGAANSIAPSGLVAGGVLRVPVSRNKIRGRPVIWSLPSGSCTQLPMPPGYADLALVNDVNSAGTAVGMASDASGADVAVLWSNGVPTILGGTGARAISEDGTIVVGLSGGMPSFWSWNGSSWSAAVMLGPSCGSNSGSGWANDVNASGVIVGKDCAGRARQWAVSGTTVVSSSLLPGLGPPGNGRAEAVNSSTASGSPGIAGVTNDRAVSWPVP